MAAFPPTVQQVAVLTALRTTTSHLAIIARAGCGKTSTIKLAVADIVARQPWAESLVLAYNKAIADEVGADLKAMGLDWRQAQASTMHSMGFSLLKWMFKPAIDDKKVRRLIEARNDEFSTQYREQIETLVRYGKQAGVGFFPDSPIGDVKVWHQLADHFDINGLEDTSEADAIVEVAQAVYRASLAQTDVIDFDDMILMPLVKNLRTKFTKDYVFLDEAQDLSRARQALARKFVRPGTGRMIVVGDDRQAIYGFSGADAAALDNLVTSLGATVLPLSVTWRCPRAVVALAQELVPDIECAPTAPEGEVLYEGHRTKEDEAIWIASLRTGDAILCRNTAPLITTAYKIVRSGRAAKVEGRQIGDGMKVLAQRWKVKSLNALEDRLNVYVEREVQKALAKGSEDKAEEVQDRVDTLREIIGATRERGGSSVADAICFIDELFADDARDAIILATYHRAKGREWDRVYLWEHSERCPSKAARQPWQLVQEHNLAYVAITRAKRTLTFVSGRAE